MATVSPPASVESNTSIQSHAAHLLEVADAVQQSYQQRKEKIENLTNSKIFGLNGSIAFDDSMRSTLDNDEPPPKAEINSAESSTNESKLSYSDKKKSRFQTVTELKSQIIECNKALVTLQENADLKHRKLELQLVEMKSALETSRKDLENAKAEIQRLKVINQHTELTLRQAVGPDKAEWVKSISLESSKLTEELAKIKQERDDTVSENETLKKAMASCAKCEKTLPNRDPSERNDKVAKRLSFWNSLNVAIEGLTAEAEAIPLTPELKSRPVSSAMKQPPPEMFVFQEQSDQIKVSLEAEIQDLEKQMLEDIDALKSERSKKSGSSRERRSHQHRDRRKSRDKSITLDAFFASASNGLSLQDEEVDEECSIFSKSRSIASAPVGDVYDRKKKSAHREHGKSKSSSASVSCGIVDRRGNFRLSTKSTSFRQSFRASFIGLSNEVTEEPRSSPTFHATKLDSRGDKLGQIQLEVQQWRGTPEPTVLAL